MIDAGCVLGGELGKVILESVSEKEERQCRGYALTL